MKALRSLWSRSRDRLGPAGMAGCALLVVSVGLYIGAVVPQRAARDVAQAKAQELQLRSRKNTQASPVKADVPEQLRTFYGFFPGQDTAADWLARIHAAAAKEGLALLSGEYRLNHERGARLARYQVTFPVKGSYVQIRRFIAAILAQVPAAALDDIVLQRESVSEPNLEARIRLTIFFGAAG